MSAVLRGSSRIARHVVRSQTRLFASSSVSRKDIVQELYLNELRTYKPPPTAKDAHVGVVKPLSIPPTPKAPTAPTDLASELAAYDAQDVALSSASPTGKSGASATDGDIVDDSGSGAKEFLAFLEADLPKHEAHH